MSPNATLSITHQTHTYSTGDPHPTRSEGALLPACLQQFSISTNLSHPKMTKLYTLDDLSHHNTNNDCWLLIDGKVHGISFSLMFWPPSFFLF